MDQSYTPNDKILEKYARLLVSVGMQTNDGKKLPRGSFIRFMVEEPGKPLYYHLQKEILRAGHHPMGVLLPSNTNKYKFDTSFYEYASKKQLTYFAEDYANGLAKQVDGNIYVIAENDPLSLEGVNSKDVLKRTASQRKLIEMLYAKADKGKLAWTIALYGTDAQAKQADISLQSYWNQIIKACRLDLNDPVLEWKKIIKTLSKTAKKLDKLNIEKVHVEGADVDLHIGIGTDRRWIGGTGNNIPSFEIFTSPNFRNTEGWIRFNQPHFRYGKKIEGIELEFKKGKVTKYKADKNQNLLEAMLKTKGGNFIGEFSLTDARISNITKFMAEILYDENTGGRYGNTHIALGNAYRDCYKNDGSNYSEDKWQELGYNKSVVHSDLISTTNRKVTATLNDGSELEIYKDGKFTI